MSLNPLISMLGITKRFGNILANDCADFSLRCGEIHAIVGENGAGKSTLMKVLYGLYQPDAGTLFFDNKPVQVDNPRTAIRLGIGMVQQHFTLIPALSVLENISLGKEPRRYKIFSDDVNARRTIISVVEQLGFKLNLDAKIESLPIAAQQYSEIVKSLYHGASVLILDEPTAVLAPQEVTRLFDCLRGLKNEGKSVILITHKLREVMEIADTITVMRDGKSIASFSKSETNPAQLTELMIGERASPSALVGLHAEAAKHTVAKPTSTMMHEPDVQSTRSVLSLNKITLQAENGRHLLNRVSLEVYGGEILGIAGVEGNGQNELIKVLTGLCTVDSGEMTLNGKSIIYKSVNEIRRLGLAHLVADRHRHGINLMGSIDENLIIGYHYKLPFSRYGLLQSTEIRDFAKKAITKYRILAVGIDARIHALSGGNQQKVVVARELENKPTFIIASHPTRGLDFQAVGFVHEQLMHARDQGRGVLLISPDIEELLKLSDRIAVMLNGRIVDIIQASQTHESELGELMLGTASLDA
ncbi:MAG: ABC transporter ATP-binding protein [Candidatus Poribacteria bacterium]|nr:ABC transporter ATP-binding protein [Candidatus Poribacteria bacterium]MDE0504079.1 ABC transporter ATP-binding protein [Candidatus Poribacteria bacterium]